MSVMCAVWPTELMLDSDTKPAKNLERDKLFHYSLLLIKTFEEIITFLDITQNMVKTLSKFME